MPATTRRLSIDEAAHHLAISPRTVRRRIRDGSLPAEREDTPQGFRYVVLIEDGAAPAEHHHEPPPASPDTAMLETLLAQVTSERDFLRRQVEQLTQQAENAQVLLLRATEERGRLLSGPVQPGSRDHDMTRPAPTPAASQPGRRRPPWWRRFLQALADSL